MRFTRKNHFASAGCVCIFGIATALGQNMRPVTPRDCATVRYFRSGDIYPTVSLNESGSRVAYLVKTPNMEQNRDIVQLFVKDVPGPSSDGQGRLLLSATDITHPVWLADGKHLVVLVKEGSRGSVVQVDSNSGARTSLTREDFDVREFSISSDGDVLVFATEVPTETTPEPTPKEIATGYRISFMQPTATPYTRRKLWILKRRPTGSAVAEPLSVPQYWKTATSSVFPYVLNLRLSVSPDGRKLALSYIAPSGILPSDWTSGGYVKTLMGLTAMALVTEVDDLQTGHLTAPLNIPWISNVPMWSSDSKGFVMVGMPPVGSDLEREDLDRGLGVSDVDHELWIDAETGKVEKVPVPMPIRHTQGQPLYWSRQGDLILRTGELELTMFTHQAQGWEEKSKINLPFKNLFQDAELASDGHFVIGDSQATTVPPQLFQYEIGKPSADVLVRLDPQFDTLTLAPFDRIEWKTSTDYTITGMLFRPPDYVEGKKYPLVIQTKGDAGQFLCDFGQFHFPSFAPQPMANAGMMYLIRTVDRRTWNSVTEINHYPKGYPAGIGEAAFQMDIWDSAVKSLDARGLIDPAKVGVIGFSRSGWYTEFMLAHSAIRYRAATAADNVQYSLGEYWLWRLPQVVQTYGSLYGGPPSGPTLDNWLKYSISFNLEKINTPLLLEVTGQGVHETVAGAVPLKLAAESEVFSGLSAMKKPVELYYYPDEVHSPEHPQARLANLQRNLDWYRFWLQGYERPNPEDPQQYLRWESLRKLEDRKQNSSPD